MIHLPIPSPIGRADLHSHTTASDGTLDPASLVRWAADQGLACLGITDHDTIAAWPQAIETATQVGLEIVLGCELSTEVANTEVHILAYYFDPAEPAMADMLARMRGGRRARAIESVVLLHKLGHTAVSLERILELGGESVGRPHIAMAMIEAKVVRSMEEAFNRFLGRGQPAYVPRPHLTPDEAISTVKQAGGVPVIAHPGLIRDDNWVRKFIAAGALGIEAYHTDHSDGQQQFYARWAHDAGLICTGGSDSHGPKSGRTVVPGSVSVDLEVVTHLKLASQFLQSQPS